MYRYDDSFVAGLFEDIGRLILGESADRASVWERLCDLAVANAPEVAAYWQRTERGRGIPDAAFKDAPPYFFADREPARSFRTSGTTGSLRGSASYSPRGLELMNLSILENARRHITAGLEHPAIIRFVPSARAAPHMIMAYGMELIAETLGDATLSDVVIGAQGLDHARLLATLGRVERAGVPAILIGASFAFVNICEQLERDGRRFALPAGSRVIDAGGFKGRAREIGVDEMRALVTRTLGIGPGGFVNLFGMTELASQLYDAHDVSVGPLGQRPKARLAFVEPRVRDVDTMALRPEGRGLLEVVDLCILDRPAAVLTGDWGIATPHGVAITGRIQRGQSRGCSLTLDEITGSTRVHHG